MKAKFLLTSALVLLSFSVAQAAVKDGTFEGTANGRNGALTTGRNLQRRQDH